MRRRFRHPHFGSRQPRRNPIKETSGIQTGRGSTCQHCRIKIKPGEQYVRFQLAKAFRVPCATCGTTPKRAKRYHPACRPTDVNKAMNYNPNAASAPFAPPPPTAQRDPTGGAVPPPPKPKSSAELRVESIILLEAALAAGIRERNVVKTPELSKAFEQLKDIKARIARPGTPGEEEAAINVAVMRAYKMVFGGRG